MSMEVGIGLYDKGGGPVDYIRQLVKHYSIDVSPVILHNFSTDERIDGIPNIPVKTYPKYLLPLYASRIIRDCRGLDIIHNNGCGWFNRITDVACKRHGIKSVITSHGLYREEWSTPGEWKWGKKENRRLLKSYSRADAIIAVSQYTRGLLKSSFGVKKDIDVIYNGVDVEEFSDDAFDHERAKGDTIQILFTGLLWKYKDPMTLIEACKKLSFEPHIVFTREGYLKENVLQKAKKYGLDVEITGYIQRKEYLRLLAKSDVFVSSSLIEQFSIAILEAMAAGCLCVISNVGGNPEAVRDGEDGSLFEFGNVDGLAEGIEKAIEKPQIGRTARKRVMKNFTWQKLVPHVEEVYKRVLNN